MRDKFHISFRTCRFTLYALVCLVLAGTGLWRPRTCWAVSSKITRHSSSEDLLKGETKDVVVSSRGTIQLGRAAETLIEKFEDPGAAANAKNKTVHEPEPWSINCIVVSGEAVFVGTSPNGGIYKYSLGKLTKIYPAESEESQNPNDVEKPGGETAEAEQYLLNEHIFAMATDIAGRLLAGISGDKCILARFEADKMEVIFEPNDAKESSADGGTRYIFAITTDPAGNIYLATGPEGKVYKLDSFGKKPQVIYDSRDKNILSLAIRQDGFVYAGSDSRGLIYKINPRTKTATVLYDSEQQEIAALLFSAKKGKKGPMPNLYAAATSAKVAQARAKFAVPPLAGRPETQLEKQKGPPEQGGGLKLKIANTKKTADDKPPKMKVPVLKKVKPDKASYIYKVTPDGYVTDIFSEAATLFALTAQDGKLLIGAGNTARLFTLDPASEEEAVVYEDRQASQLTAVAVARPDVYLGTANPAKLIKLGNSFATEGTFTSDLIDAGQPAMWGKLQIEADIPKGCKVQAVSRSGNVKDVNDPTFSAWTEPVEVTEPAQLRCPPGRFCQYKLVLQSKDGRKSPLIRQIAVAHTIPNLAPRVESVSVNRIEAAGKTGLFKISYKARDDNNDKLIYKIDFRKLGRTGWIKLEDELESNSFEWDAKTVEDGRYEVRVTASDRRSNTTTTKLTNSRISEPVIVDNTGPVIKKHSISTKNRIVTLILEVVDEFTAIGKVHYTVDSNAEWKATLPDDLVYDTCDENFTIVIEQLEAGEHIIAVAISDDVGNTMHKTFEVEITKNAKRN